MEEENQWLVFTPIYTNKTLKYTVGKEYEAFLKSWAESFIVIQNDIGDNVVVPLNDFYTK